MYWISIPSGNYVKQSSDLLYPLGKLTINSYVGHEFALVEVEGPCVVSSPANRRKVEEGGDDRLCKEARFVVSESQNQVVEITDDGEEGEMKVRRLGERGLLLFVVCSWRLAFLSGVSERCVLSANRKCTNRVKQKRHADTHDGDWGVFVFQASLIDDSSRSSRAADAIVASCFSGVAAGSPPSVEECVHSRVSSEVSRLNARLAREKEIRTSMASMLEEYTCDDPALNTTSAVSSDAWGYVRAADGVKERQRDVDVLFDTERVKIHVVHDFISPEECAAVEAVTRKGLARATVADGAGGSEYSENRKALQSSMAVPWDKEGGGDLVAR